MPSLDSPLVNTVEVPKVKPQPPVFCISCNLKFDSKAGLKEHNNVCPKKQSSAPTNAPEQLGSNIPVIPSSVSPRVSVAHNSIRGRNYNCHQCDFETSGSGRSKMLLRHAIETGHKTDSLEEKCYTCGTVTNNFEDLMVHRKLHHADRVKPCHHGNECRFKTKCWYIHPTDHSQSNNSPASQQGGFQQSHQPFPPDQVALLKEMLTAFQLAKGNSSQTQNDQQRLQGV